jgi:hypothetical protein
MVSQGRQCLFPMITILTLGASAASSFLQCLLFCLALALVAIQDLD